MASEDDAHLELGYWLSSEEHGPNALVEHAVAAEAAGFRSAMISDHTQPWTPMQGESAFVWGVLGAIGQATQLRVGTGVSTVHRLHPAVLAQAAATAALLTRGRFFLGLGTGERLNEQIFGDRWPGAGERRRRLEEALPLIRRLLEGETVTHHGDFFRLERARVHSCPAAPPPLYVAAAGRRAARLAGELGDGLIGAAPQPEIVHAFEAAGGLGKPRHAQLKVCWAEDRDAAVATARRWFATAALPAPLLSELSTPEAFAAAAASVTDEQVARAVVCGPDVTLYQRAIERTVGAGFTHVFLHQVGPDQDGFFEFYRRELAPRFAASADAVAPAATGPARDRR